MCDFEESLNRYHMIPLGGEDSKAMTHFRLKVGIVVICTSGLVLLATMTERGSGNTWRHTTLRPANTNRGELPSDVSFLQVTGTAQRDKEDVEVVLGRFKEDVDVVLGSLGGALSHLGVVLEELKTQIHEDKQKQQKEQLEVQMRKIQVTGVGQKEQNQQWMEERMREWMEEWKDNSPEKNKEWMEDLKAQASKELAKEEEEAGNAAMKKKDFDEAIRHYEAAIALDGTDIAFLTNLAAVHFERGEWDACIERCDQAVEQGQELRLPANSTKLAKALTRKGLALTCKGEYSKAVATLKQSLTYHNDENFKRKLSELIKQLGDEAYIDRQKCEEAWQKGNDLFKEQKFKEAVEQYTEALRRGPPKVNPEAYKIFCNRADSNMKLNAYENAEKDADACIEVKPDCLWGHMGKAAAQSAKYQYIQAQDTLKKALTLLPDSSELKTALGSANKAVDMMAAGNNWDWNLKTQLAGSGSQEGQSSEASGRNSDDSVGADSHDAGEGHDDSTPR